VANSQSLLLRLTERLERSEALDGTSARIQHVVEKVLPKGRARGLLAGSWMGHALHPLLTDVPIGTWTSSIVLDVIGGTSSESAADILIGVGLAAVAPTALTGWSDWSETRGENRRVGLVHAAANITATSCFAASLALRHGGRRDIGRLLSLSGATVLSVGGYLGGHLSYARRVGTGER
jgi:uncharacterized membrane protein